MKTPNKNVKRLVVWSVASSLVGSSCSGLYADHDLDRFTTEVNNRVIGKQAAISIHLSDEQYESYVYYANIVDQIISDRSFAKKMIENPSRYLCSRSGNNISGNIDDILILDTGLQRLLQSFADDDIMNAIDAGDVKAYLYQMKNKGFLYQQIEENYDVLNREEKKLFLLSLGVEDPDAIVDSIAVGVFVALFYFAAAVISHVAGMYTAFVAANMVAGFTIVVDMAAYTSVSVAGLHLNWDKEFDIWLLSSSDEDGDKVINLNENECREAIDNVIQVYSEIFADEVKDIDIDRLIDTVRLNVNKQIESDLLDLNNE